MRREYKSGFVGAVAVTTAFLAADLLEFGWQWPSILLALPIFAFFFGLFYRLERYGEMMSPLWIGIFGIAATSHVLFGWTDVMPGGSRLLIDAVFIALFVFLAVHGIRTWVHEERRRNQRSGG